MKTPGGEGNISPETQMTKLREQDRSGGVAAGSARPRPHSGSTDVPVTPQAESFALREEEQKAPPESAVELDLSPDANDKDMEHLLGILKERGWNAVMAELDRIDNPHIEDDFHRLLVQYKKDGHRIPGIREDDPLNKALDSMLFEVAVPVYGAGAGERSLKEIFTEMEQLYISLIPHVGLPDPIFFKRPRQRAAIMREHFVFELAVHQESEEAVFYVAINRAKRAHFEKQTLAIFPRARIVEKKDDYNIFNQFGVTVASRGRYVRGQATPIRTGQGFDYDPLNVTLSAFSKISKEGEGAAIQFLVAPAGDYLKDHIRKALQEMQKGSSIIAAQQKWWLFPTRPLRRSLIPKLWKSTGEFFEEAKDEKKDDKEKTVDTTATQTVADKIKSPVYGVNIRIVASARTKERAEAMLSDIEATFGQFENAEANRLGFDRVTKKKELKKYLRSFIWRTFDRAYKERPFPFWMFSTFLLFQRRLMYMNAAELSALYHLAVGGTTSSREVKASRSAHAPAPPGLPEKGICLGRNVYANIATDIRFAPDDRLRHLYTIGQTGTGKTNFLKQMITQDIENGDGVCFIDPHGVDVQDILSRIPKERYDDLIYFDPAYTDRPMGLNMLEYDPRFPEQKTFVVDEMFKIFKKLYGDVPEAFGPIFESYFRNATLLVLEDPETGSTLMDISRVLSDEDFRHLKLSRSKNAVVNHFWEEVAEQVRGEGDIRNVVPYITSKFDIFIANEIMRPIVGQQRSVFDFKDVMDNKKILLVNLSKGRLGDINANLLGLIVVGKILMAALSRSETLGRESHPPFYLYLDEFQNVTTDTIATILSEARKYRLSLTIAHQFISQLSGDRIKESIRNAVFGNVGTLAAFRVGSDDAQFLEKMYAPTFTASDMIHIDNYNAYMKLLADGKPVQPFSMETIAYRSGDYAQIDALKQMSYQRYGRPREAVEGEVREKYRGIRGIK